MKTESLLKRLVKEGNVLFLGSAEQCERAADELFALARERGLSPGKAGTSLRLYEARDGKESVVTAAIEFAAVPRGRTPKVLRFRAGEWPVAVLQEQSVILADE